MKLSDIAIIEMGQSPSKDDVNSEGLGLPLLNGPSEFTNFYPMPVQFTDNGKKFADIDDVLFCVRGSTTGRMNFADQKYAIGRGLASLSGINGYPTSFVRVVLEQSLPRILASATGSTFPNVGKELLNNLLIADTDVNSAQKVGEIYTDFTKKIQLNNETNQTLEQIAQAIFKSWFVDFDPVHAKANALNTLSPRERAGVREKTLANQAAMCAISGKTAEQLAQFANTHPEDYAQLKTTAEAFPSGFDEAGIPEGWEVGSFQDICVKIESGGTPKRSDGTYWNGNISWLSSGEVRDEMIIETKEQITQEGLDNSSAKLWSENTTVIAMYGATAGQVCLLAIETTANQACCGLTPKEKHSSFLFFNAKNSIEDLSGKASGSAQQNLNKGLIENHQIYIPNFDVISFFDIATSRLIEKIKLNYFENKMLAETRDELLPKLLNGEINTSETRKNQ